MTQKTNKEEEEHGAVYSNITKLQRNIYETVFDDFFNKIDFYKSK